MHSLLARKRVENRVDSLGRKRTVRRIAGNVRFIHLKDRTRQDANLRRENTRYCHGELLEILVVKIEQSSRQHVRAGDGKLKLPSGNRGGAFAVSQQVQPAFPKPILNGSGGSCAKPHRREPRKGFVITSS